jgi:rubredoxin
MELSVTCRECKVTAKYLDKVPFSYRKEELEGKLYSQGGTFAFWKCPVCSTNQKAFRKAGPDGE